MGDLLGSAAEQADPQSQPNLEKAAAEQEQATKAEELKKLKVEQTRALSTARARAAAGGAGGSGLVDYFSSAQKMFERENKWLSRTDVRSGVVSEHSRYYKSASKQKGFGFLDASKDNKDWWL